VSPTKKKENKKMKRAVHNTTQKQLKLPAMELVPPMTHPRALQFDTLPLCILGSLAALGIVENEFILKLVINLSSLYLLKYLH
jgi:hypothetical protein